jgi:hypothetical protein
MGFLRSQDTTAFVELAFAAHCRVSAAGVSDAPTDRTDRRRLNPHNDLSPARMPAVMKRLFIDSGVASSRPGVDGQGVAVLPGGVLHPAPSGPHQKGTPPRECPGSKQGPSWVPGQRRRDDPQAVFGRLACGERLANPTPWLIDPLTKGRQHVWKSLVDQARDCCR